MLEEKPKKEKEIEKKRGESKRDFFSRCVDKTLNFIFSRDNRRYVLLAVILGFILRVLTALRNKFYADEMIYVPHSIGFLSTGKLQIYVQSSVWFWLTDLSSRIFGVNAFGVRFLTVLFGTLSIILIYLLGKELFNEKVGLISSFIFAFCPLQLLHMEGEMDVSMTFFAMLSLYLLVLSLKRENKIGIFVLSWVALGVAIMMKPIALLFIPAFTLFFFYYNKKYHNKFKFKKIIYAAIIIILMVLPVLTYNYLLYKDKGLVDIQFARFTNLGFEKYENIAHTIQPFNLKNLILGKENQLPGIVLGFKIFYNWIPFLTLIFALAGLFYFYKGKNRFFWLFVLAFLFPFVFLAGTSLMSKHFVFGSFFITLFGSLGIVKISDKFRQEKTRKIFLYTIIILILIFSFVKVYRQNNGFIGKNQIAKMIDFKQDNMEKNSLVIVDNRIYRGRVAFMFHDRHYLEAVYFDELLKEMDNLPGINMPVTTYFIEAASDDSGWGTINQQSELNQSMENLVSFFKEKTQFIGTIKDIENRAHFNVYETSFPLKSSVFDYADSTHVWFYYQVGYGEKGANFDDYVTYNAFDTLLDRFAHMVLYADLLLVLLLALYLIYIFYKNR